MIGWRLEVGDWRSEVGGQRLEVAEVGGWVSPPPTTADVAPTVHMQASHSYSPHHTIHPYDVAILTD